MRFLLDSNIIIGFLNGDIKIAEWVYKQKKESSWLAISPITKIEVLSFKELKEEEIEKIEKFLEIFQMAYFNDNVINIAAALRRKNYLCLGDAIIAATAITGQYTLITNDRDFAKKVEKFIPVISI